MRTLSLEEARDFYDRFGRKQDRQAFYEAAALESLIAHADPGLAHSLFEFGCGTGRLAEMLLESHLPADAVYRGIDLSATMVRIASSRLARFGARASATQSSGEAELPVADSSFDRFVSTYVLDLLPDAAVARVVREARRVLRPDGLLCLTGITSGTTPLSRIVMGGWRRLFAVRPAWVGGCRPTSLLSHVGASDWIIRYHDVVVAWGIASEILVASPAPGGRGLPAPR